MIIRYGKVWRALLAQDETCVHQDVNITKNTGT